MTPNASPDGRAARPRGYRDPRADVAQARAWGTPTYGYRAWSPVGVLLLALLVLAALGVLPVHLRRW
jgi:hypothetical protein